MHQLYGVLFLFGFTLVISGLTVMMCYLWLRTIHSPLRLYQRKMLTYVAIVMYGSTLGPACMASTYWLMPLRPSGIAAIILFLIWAITAFLIVGECPLLAVA